MKTNQIIILILFALCLMVACEPEEEILPDHKTKIPALSFGLEAKTILPQEGKDDKLAVELNWQRELKSGQELIVERSLGDSTSWSEIAQLNKNATSFKDTEIQGDSIFFYRIKILDSDANAIYSRTAFLFPKSRKPNAPSNLVDNSVPSSSDKMDLSWQDNSFNETGFIIERSPDGNSWKEIKRVRTNITSYQDHGLKAATKYYYRVFAYAFENKILLKSNPSNVAEGTTNIGTPINVSAEGLGPSKVKLNWDYNTEEDIMIIIERSLDGNSWQRAGTVGSHNMTFTDSNLEEETLYYYRLFAEKGSVQSSFSQIVNATTFLNTCLESGSIHSQSFAFIEGCELTNVTIYGNLSVANGTLRLINCNITGNVTQHGEGNIEIFRDSDLEGSQSYIKGNIIELEAGSIVIDGSQLQGNLEEFGTGDISIINNSEIGEEFPGIITSSTYVVNEDGLGNIRIENSKVVAHIGEKNKGDINVLYESDILGDISEQDDGDLTIENSQVSGNNIGEQSTGNIIIENSSIHHGYSSFLILTDKGAKLGEQGSGYIRISGSNVIANITENGHGNIDILNDSNIGNENFPGNVAEADGGFVYLRDSSIIWGNLAESGYGQIILTNPANVKGNYASN
ncbi:fibronectin type III domain-containing protein [Flexithrix dorotheae]|uniref:fibronectin type III domain-containing protein n=1 Tax=Flexithrix dorotheae TaxID=70993 RepID=UPI0012F7BC64|nr:fibronectin type III domain-containing protein [Flexithrix dorotheae]